MHTKALSLILVILAIISITQQQSTKVRVTNGVSDSEPVFFCFLADGDLTKATSVEVQYSEVTPYFNLNETEYWVVGVYSKSGCQNEDLITSNTTITTDPTFKYTFSFVGLLSTSTSLVVYYNYTTTSPPSGSCQINLYFQAENTTDVTLALYSPETPNQSTWMEEVSNLYGSSGYVHSDNIGDMFVHVIYEFVEWDYSISGVSVRSNFTFEEKRSYSVFAWGLLTYDDFDSLQYAIVLDDEDDSNIGSDTENYSSVDVSSGSDSAGAPSDEWIWITSTVILAIVSVSFLLVIVAFSFVFFKKRNQFYSPM